MLQLAGTAVVIDPLPEPALIVEEYIVSMHTVAAGIAVTYIALPPAAQGDFPR